MARLAIALLAGAVGGAFGYGLWQRRCRQFEARRADEARRRIQELQADVDDLTEQVDASRRDSLTGLLARDQWESEAAALLAGGQARAVLWVDLDRFKDVNSTFGHLAGNVALAEIGRRLHARNDGSVVGRFGGDEFVLVLPYRPSDVHLEELAKQVSRPITVTTPLEQTPRTLAVTASIGVATWRSATPHDVPLLLDLADRAMRSAKKIGDCAVIVQKQDPVRAPRRVSW